MLYVVAVFPPLVDALIALGFLNWWIPARIRQRTA
jgi:hypothetical protein